MDIIIFGSLHGATKRYAERLAEMTGINYQSVFFYLPSTISIPALSKATKELIISIKNGEKIEGLDELDLDLDAINEIKDSKDDEWEAFMNLSKEDQD